MQDGASTLMSIRDAAQATGLSPKALRRRIERGTLTSVMIGGRRRIPMEALARRGLIAPDRHGMGAQRLGELAGQAIEDRLRGLESRISTLEAAVAGRLGAAQWPGADTVGHAGGDPTRTAARAAGGDGGAPSPERLGAPGSAPWPVAFTSGARPPVGDDRAAT